MERIWRFVALAILLGVGATGVFAGDKGDPVHFVPDSQEFWDHSKNWPTNYGPAYRDTNESASNFLPCTGTYALCFSSGPEPLPCELDESGRFASCKCTIETGLQFVTITSILNYDVYLETVAVCGADGSKCTTQVDKAPVCRYIQEGKFIPGADVISDFSPQLMTAHTNAMKTTSSTAPITQCPKAPYAGCMTAPCQIRGDYAECSCPVFWGPFQLTQSDAQCQLSDDLVWSASYTPTL
jgi:hypothetical protein